MLNKEAFINKKEKKISIESEFENAKMLFDYLSKNRKYNLFLIDNVDGLKVRQLKTYIDKEDKINAIKLYRQLSIELDNIRNYYCYNHLAYKSSFRAIAKDMYLFLKESWLLYTDEFFYIGKTLRFISTSSHYEINRYFKKRAYSLYYMERINIDPDSFYNHQLNIEVFMDYTIKLLREYMRSD